MLAINLHRHAIHRHTKKTIENLSEMDTCMFIRKLFQMVKHHGNVSREEDRLKLDSLDRFVESVNEHSHTPSQTQYEAATVKSGIKRRAETTNDTTQQVLAGEMAGISPAAAANLPQLGNIRRTIRSQRQTNENLPPLPATRAAIPVLPAEFRTTLSGQQFLLHDSGVADNDRILMFGSPDGVSLLEQSADWFADGTFKTVHFACFSWK